MNYNTFMAIDIGTTFIKGAILNLERPHLAHIRRVPFPEPNAGRPALFCEIDAHVIVAAVRGLIEELLPHAPNCGGILLCGQMGGLVLTTDTGLALSNYISWRDQRMLAPGPTADGSYFDQFLQQITSVERRQFGNELQPGNSISLLFWLMTQGRALPPGAIAASLPDFVVANLCRAMPATEMTLATGSLNLETLDWHREVLARLTGEPIGWPRLCDFREPVGEANLGGRRLPCYAPAGDHACALAGAFIGQHELSLNISTGSQVSLLTTKLQLGDFQTRPYFEGRFLNTITHIPAGRSLNLLLGLASELAVAQGARLNDPWPVIQRAAEAAGGTDLTVDLAFFPSPVGDRGAISNIREGNLTLGQLFYAAFRSMADNYLACARRLSPSQAWKSLLFSGGVAQKLELLRRMIATRFDCGHRLCPWPEDTLVGLMTLALVIGERAPSVAAATEILRNCDDLITE